LVVEDSPQVAATLEVALDGMSGIEVTCLEGAPEALDWLKGVRGDLVCALVTDLHMPGVDGFELIERVRALPDYRKLPIIALSGDTNPGTPARALSSGADAFFAKPCSPVQLRRRLAELMDERRRVAE